MYLKLHSRGLCEWNTPRSSYTLLPSMSMAHPPVSHATWAQWISEGTEPHRQGSNSPESTLCSLPFHQPGAQRSRTAVGLRRGRVVSQDTFLVCSCTKLARSTHTSKICISLSFYCCLQVLMSSFSSPVLVVSFIFLLYSILKPSSESEGMSPPGTRTLPLLGFGIVSLLSRS